MANKIIKIDIKEGLFKKILTKTFKKQNGNKSE